MFVKMFAVEQTLIALVEHIILFANVYLVSLVTLQTDVKNHRNICVIVMTNVHKTELVF